MKNKQGIDNVTNMNTFQILSAGFIVLGGLMAAAYYFYRRATIIRIMGNQHSFTSYYISFSDKALVEQMRALAGNDEAKKAKIDQFVKARKVFLISLAIVLVLITAAQMLGKE